MHLLPMHITVAAEDEVSRGGKKNGGNAITDRLLFPEGEEKEREPPRARGVVVSAVFIRA